MTGAIRHLLDYDYVIPALLRNESFEKIAARETVRLDTVVVTRNTIAGVKRDLMAGTLKTSSARQNDNGWVKTYVYGLEPDNGGLPVFTGHMTIDGDAVVISDLHVPFTDFKFAESVIPWAKYYGIRQMVIAGDLMDGNSQNTFKRKVRPVPFSKELELSRELIAYFSTWFNIVFEPGNHDDWFLQNQDGNLTIRDFYNLLAVADSGKFTITPYDRVTVISGGEPWVIPHQAEASAYSLFVGDKLSQKFQANVIVPHQHNSADGFDRYRRYRVIDIGGLHDPDLMAYANLKTTTKPRHDQGFAILKDGRGILITPDRRQTDWSIIGA